MNGREGYFVDRARFVDLIMKNGISVEEAAHEIGYSSSAINTALRKGKLTLRMVKGFENKYGITYDMIKREEPEQEPEPKEQAVTADSPTPQVDLSKIEEMLVTLVKIMQNNDMTYDMVRALNSWWFDVSKEFIKNLRGTIYSATLVALQKHDETIREERGI